MPVSSFHSDQEDSRISDPLDEEELQSLYTWVDSIPLSRPKKNISRDFADGVLMAEIVKHYFPRLIELHNYSSASSTGQKLYNWNTLNQKFFKKVGFNVSKQEISDIVNAKSGAIEVLLRNFQAKLNSMRLSKENNSDIIQEPKSSSRAQSAKRTAPPQNTQPSSQQRSASRGPSKQSAQNPSNYDSGYPGAPSSTISNGAKSSNGKVSNNNQAIDVDVIDPNDPRVAELQETIKILEAKVNKLNLLLRLKDSKIHALTEKLKQSNVRV